MYILLSCSDIPDEIAKLISMIIDAIKISVPIVLIILGMIDMFKASASQKEDEMKKAQLMFFKRIIAAVLVFFVIAIVQFVLFVLSQSGVPYTDCISTIINS